ncbi:MFS transporter [Chondrinema litorale]|uniref:MFS transporter n=1 Tax=Chondrinema litorale TaxID=2994555 RepID=UPI002543AAB7|nr:MFS transporter [Chondrinema litorale]UZR93769.1 MFS transporter [Chondrinema litorale]
MKNHTRQANVWVLASIVFAQFAGTSLWFAGNAILPELQKAYHFPENTLSHITTAVQLGFIVGTLIYAIFSIADRFSPSKVFFISALAGAICNVSILFIQITLPLLITFRFLTGVFLAGIYPVGMKIAADWYEKGLGKALGFLVGALVLGTAFPHLLNSMHTVLNWQHVLISVSLFAISGGILILILRDGPFRKKGSKFNPKAIFKIFSYVNFRKSAFGYFGHMWELYTFWAFLPWLLKLYGDTNNEYINISLCSFIIIGIGFFSCILGGLLSLKKGSYYVAKNSLSISGLCCLLSPIVLILPFWLMISFLLIWSFFVISDSPQFSSLVAASAPKEITGTALTIVNSTGFTISIISIQLLGFLSSIDMIQPYLFLALLPGPILGLLSIRSLNISSS